MDFKEALDWLNSFQFHGIKPGLERIEKLLSYLGHPEKKFPAIHIAGTNGKGSTAAILATALSAQGLKVGLYTSPHLVSVRERFQINGNPIEESSLAALLNQIKKGLEELALPATYFEITTAAAFLYFAQEKVDLAVVECGLGGRLDATNVCHPLLTLITNVALDHQKYLGPTLEAIAREKAGIFKPERPALVGKLKPPALKVIEERAQSLKVPLFRYGKDFRIRKKDGLYHYYGPELRLQALELSLSGPFQRENLALALAALEKLKAWGWPLKEALLRKALKRVNWPGRCEYLAVGPGVLLDGAHNLEGSRALLKALKEREFRDYTLIFGATDEGGDKPYRKMLSLLSSSASQVFLCEPPGPRHPVTLKEWEKVRPQGARTFKSWEEALEEALKEDHPILVAGSLYLVGAVREKLRGLSPKRRQNLP